MTTAKKGQIVWHDLFTSNRSRAMAFYERVAGWNYEVEHATNFAWGGGQKDFILAKSGDEAGAGFAETPPDLKNGWIAYVEVTDVDAAVELAEANGGKVVRRPFEVPGVGRNALVGDPLGALIGVSLSRHSFPVPIRQFGPEIYLSNGASFPETFYQQVFGWRAPAPARQDQSGTALVGLSGEPLAWHLRGIETTDRQAIWLPSIKVTSADDAWHSAAALGGRRLETTTQGAAGAFRYILYDPEGALLLLSDAQGGPCPMA